MIVSHKHRFVFIHIEKCAGTSVTNALLPCLGSEDLVLGVTPEGERLHESNWRAGKLHKHSPAWFAREALGPEIWETYFKFSFIRSPWDLLVSSYHWALETTWVDPRGTIEKIRALPDFNAYLLSPYCRKANCFDYVSDRAHRHIIIDFIGRQERLAADFGEVCKRIGLPPSDLLLINPSSHAPYTDCYTPETRQRVEDWFRRDIAAFGYRWPDPASSPGN